MVGAIRKRDIFGHPVATVRCFGWRVLFKAILAGRDRTFLSLIFESGSRDLRRAGATDVVTEAIALELQAARLYDCLARRFSESAPAGAFFASLAAEERDHADLLEVCRAAAGSASGGAPRIEAPAEAAVARLREEMDALEAGLDGLRTPTDALRLVIRIESSEVNRVFRALIAGSGSDFVRSIAAFGAATGKHLAGIAARIAEIEPALAGECRALGAGDAGAPGKS
jgi:hypothetical protein